MDWLSRLCPGTRFGALLERGPESLSCGLGYGVGGAVVLGAATLALHGWSLADGTVLDDWWHQKGLREHGWSLSELLRTLVIAPADFLHCWWQTVDVRWEYARPLFILVMKIAYCLLGGQDPVALHAVSIAAHYACALMVWRLAWLLTRRALWSLVAGLLFVLYPHSVVTVAWPSSQNAVLHTALMLGSLLCYLRAGGLTRLEEPLAVATAADGGPQRWRETGATARPPARSSLVAAQLLWVLALFTRENALMLPIVFAAMDLAAGGGARLRRSWGGYAGMAVIAAAFVIWRVTVVRHAMPDVYVRWPEGDLPVYLLWLAAKLLHYLCTAIWLAPLMVGPTGRLNPWTEVPGDCLLMLVIVGVLGGGYFLVTRHLRGWWIWPLWIVLAVLPVTPLIATPHSGYSCGVGFALGAVLGAAVPRGGRPGAGRRIAGGVAIFFLVATGVFSMLNRWQWTGIIAAERLVPAWVQVSPPARTTSDVFFLNLPFVNVYCKPALVQALGPWFEDVRMHALTFAPQPVIAEERSIIRQIDAYSFSIEVQGQPYFSRLLGRFLLEGFARRGQFRTGEVIRTDSFDVRIAAADAEGVWSLVFTFPRPLTDERYCFYLCTEDVGAARIRFRSPGQRGSGIEPPCDPPAPAQVRQAFEDLATGSAAAGETLLAAILMGDGAAARTAEEWFRAVAEPVAAARGADVQRLFDHPWLTPEEWAGVRAWWRAEVDDLCLAEIWLPRHDFDYLLKQREEVPHARQWAAKAIRSDLYLTGRPFPGPGPGPSDFGEQVNTTDAAFVGAAQADAALAGGVLRVPRR